MRVVLDLQALQSESRTRGIGRNSLGFAKAVARHAGTHEIVVALNHRFPKTLDPVRAQLQDVVDSGKIFVWEAPGPVAALDDANRWRTAAGELIREFALCNLRPDIIHVASLFEGLGDEALTSIKRFDSETPVAATLHDLIPLLNPDPYLTNPVVRRWYFHKLASLRDADLLLAVSEHSRREAVDGLSLDPDRVVTVFEDTDELFQHRALAEAEVRDVLGRNGLRHGFIMYTGGVERRKNVERLMEAYANLPPGLRQNHQLAIVCQVDDRARESLEALQRKLKLQKDRVVLTGFISDDDLVKLYNLCSLFVFPSLHEGFGLPILEAMRCGAAVIGSERTSIPEVIGRKDALFDPTSAKDITTKVAQALMDDEFRNSLRAHSAVQARKFSWDASAKRALEAFEALYRRRQRSTKTSIAMPPEKPLLAYLSPLPPERSGISDYSAELLPELARYYRIELVTDLSAVADAWLEENFERRSTTYFEAQARAYDRVLYHFGNSNFHRHMFALLERFPGTVVLHDFFLSGVLSSAEANAPGSAHFRSALYRSHGYGALLGLKTLGVHGAVMTYPCNAEILANAQGVIVHSRHSGELAQQWYGRGAAEDWVRIPQPRRVADAPSRAKARAALGLPGKAFVVCSFGIVDPIKLHHRLLSAWLQSNLAGNAECHLVFVGRAPNAGFRRRLRRCAEGGRLERRFKIAGRVSAEDYARYLAAADVGVQLRTDSRGETSRAILDCLASGLPTVVNAHGSAAELSGDIVVKLPDGFTDRQLSKALEKLHDGERYRRQLAKGAQAYISERHDPSAIAHQYAQAIESFAKNHPVARRRRLVSELALQAGEYRASPREVADMAVAIAENASPRGPRQLFVDISRFAQLGTLTGIQRVACNVLKELIENPPVGFRVEPVFCEAGRFLYARSFMDRFLDLGGIGADDSPIEVNRDDVFLGLDLNAHMDAGTRDNLRHHQQRGMHIYFVIHDLLPIIHPEWWPRNLTENFRSWFPKSAGLADGLVCPSSAAADTVHEQLAAFATDRPVDIGYFRPGADHDQVPANTGICEESADMLDRLRHRDCVLMVGTVEPRKGHAHTLDAMEVLWAGGESAALAIFGKRGRQAENLAERLRRHAENGKRLFWFENASDGLLERCYASASVLLIASDAAGFGVPLIEAAKHHLPVAAKDLPEFGDGAGKAAFDFDGSTGEQLAAALRDRLATYRRSQDPGASDTPRLTWAESTRQLLEVILGGNWYRRYEPGRPHGDSPR